MNINTIGKQLKKYFSSIENLELECLYLYCVEKHIPFSQNSHLNALFENLKHSGTEKLSTFLNKNCLSLDYLAFCFQYLWNEEIRKEYGIVYTDNNIVELIIRYCIKEKNKIGKLCDPACGSGAFLLKAIEIFHAEFHLPYDLLVKSYIYGIDIKKESIEQTKALIYIFLLQNNINYDDELNIFIEDTLCIEQISKFKDEFLYVVGNPPYVRAKNIPAEIKLNFNNWETTKEGNPDLYIPFYEVGIYLLNKEGILGFISPNTFLQSINGRGLRDFLNKEKYCLYILDFRDRQIFDSVTSYTCIVFIDIQKRNDTIFYTRLENGLSNIKYSEYYFSNFSIGNPWRLSSNNVDDLIYKLENAGKKLDTWKIRNGLATLKNDLFFFHPLKQDKDYFYIKYRNEEYKIEKGICINIAKPNVLKNEYDLENCNEYGIFPYIKNNEQQYGTIDEEFFKNNYPFTYNYLSKYKKELDSRDKGNGNYAAWFAYGRTQGMNNFGKKLLIPYLSSEPIAIISLKSDLLFYCGYALFSDSEEELNILKKILTSEVFWFYIKTTSKPYANGSRSLAKNYIKNFSIPSLSEIEKKYILNEKDNKNLNKWIWNKYLSQ